MAVEEGIDVGIVHDVVRQAAEEITSSRARTPAVLRRKSLEMVDYLLDEYPDELFAYFQEHMAAILAQQLRTTLALKRSANRARRGVFDGREALVEAAESAFSMRYSGSDFSWPAVADMLRPDWVAVAEQRKPQARASLFEITLAKQMIGRFPDDETPTRAVVTEAEFQRVEKAAYKKAESTVERWK